MTDPAHVPPEPDVLPPDAPSGALSVPPPVPRKQPGFFRRLFMSRKKQQAIAVQNGYLEMVDLIRAIRSHLDRQESVQTHVLAMLEKVPDAMDRQHEVMSLFKQQLESGMENNRRLTDSMGNLNHTLAAMDESQRASSRTITDLIHRSRESEQLLREVMRRAERRMTILLAVFVLIVVGLALFFGRGPRTSPQPPAPAAESGPAASAEMAPPAAPAAPAEEPMAEALPASAEPGPPPSLEVPPQDPATDQPAPPPPPPKKEKARKRPATRPARVADQSKSNPPDPAPEFKPEPPDETPAIVGQPDLTLDLLRQGAGTPVPPEPAVSLP